ncbi:hypothetical protein [Pseudofulvimonas gallinarii]|jgi:hypothetical protein|uniref:Uncharacterized protein n=1 Tax=Pseudofulvimonas gallinarii TaxID=634155 RepID=A0A4S3L009_9GAMM|nr:hypothetical protein [Pseudofulvimonas gallinarii]TCT01261.1 hypothetical protein EDC25_101119 [Pseudofulvimonas gallinarii]THD15023.1 hypothetical protein B1808_01075 [Pseudofulvimonas gallinarii]
MSRVNEPGLVLHLYPAELLRFGASHTSVADDAVTAEHFFLCLFTDAREGLWTPMHVTRGLDRLPIPEKAKSGHARWTRGPSYYSPADLWRIPHKAIQRTQPPAGNRSGTHAPNRVAAQWLPARSDFPPTPA